MSRAQREGVDEGAQARKCREAVKGLEIKLRGVAEEQPLQLTQVSFEFESMQTDDDHHLDAESERREEVRSGRLNSDLAIGPFGRAEADLRNAQAKLKVVSHRA